jgi:hypothetical protein
MDTSLSEEVAWVTATLNGNLRRDAMRGFRGSRAAQNYMSSQHGGPQSPMARNPQGRHPELPSQGQQRPVLPDWLKTPETRAKERQNGSAQQLPQSYATAVAHIARSFEGQPQAGASDRPVAKVIPITAAKKRAAPAKERAAPTKKRAAAKPAAKRAAARPAKRRAA